MLFISPHPSYQLLGIRKAQPVYHPVTGKVMDTIPAIGAEFFHGGAPNWAIDQAVEHEPFQLLWSGLPDGQNRRAMVSSYDTDAQAREHGWDQETKEFVEDFLLNYYDYGTRYIRAVPPEELLAIPWPSYDSTQWKQVPFIAKEIGVDLEYVLSYEKSHKNRPGVITALEEAIAETPSAEPEPAVAA